MGIAEFLYYIGLLAKRSYLLRHQKRLPCSVISIGNITVGGTGKTPATIALAEEAQRRMFSPVVLTRGYGGVAKGPCFVTRGKGPLLSADEAGDEPVLMAERLKDVSVIKGSNRFEAGLFALREAGYKCAELDCCSLPPGPDMLRKLFILDDGFQHWQLYRDKNILLIDSENPFGNRTLLPSGKLREPLQALKRADIIVLTKCKVSGGFQSSGLEALTAEIRKYNEDAPLFLSGHSIGALRLQSGEKLSPDRLKGEKVFGFCALGNPASFSNTVVTTGAAVVGFRAFRDHYKFSGTDMTKIRDEARKAGAEWIVTTEKDLIKIRGLDLPEKLIIIGIEFSIDEKFYDAVFDFSRASSYSRRMSDGQIY